MSKKAVPANINSSKKQLRFAYIARDVLGASGIGTDTPKTIWLSICKECAERNISLSTYVGSITGAGFDNFIYELISAGSVDGIISWASTDQTIMQSIIEKLPKVPIVTLSVKVNNIPCVRLDNTAGMRGLVQHVIDVHHKRKIAFIRGPLEHAYAKERLRAYKETLEKSGIEVNPLLISEPGEWDLTTGQEAVRLFFDKRGLVPGTDIEAIICANDRIAVGVIEELSRRSLRCPEDIIVTGYNNLEEAKNNTPSITSVDMPFSSQGAAAVIALEEILYGMTDEVSVNDVNIPTQIAVHESCGCPNPLARCRNVESARTLNKDETVSLLESNKQILVAKTGSELSAKYASILFDCYIRSLKTGTVQCSLFSALMQSQSGFMPGAAARKYISFLLDAVYAETSNTEVLRLAEALSASMIGMFNDFEDRCMFQTRTLYIAQEERIQHMDRDMTIQQDINGLFTVLFKHLSALVIPAAYLFLYEQCEYTMESSCPGNLMLRFAYENGAVVPLPPEGKTVVFGSVFPPPDAPQYYGQNFVIRALSIKDERIGCIVFRTGPLDGYIYESVAAKLNSAVKNVYMKESVRHQAEKLDRLNKELQQSLTMLKETQEHLIESEKMASLGSLVAGIAHEINTPVGIGVTVSSLIEEKNRGIETLFRTNQLKKSDLEEYIQKTDESVQILSNNMAKAAQLIQSFKQIAVDQSDEVVREFYVGKYIDDVLISLNPLYRKTAVKVTVSYSEDTLVTANAGALSQILSNLVVNSMTHGFPDGADGEIIITAERKNDIINIVYSDSGKGISKENLHKIFEPFFTTKRGAGGSGLGLYITYNLVTRSLKGTIKCVSTLGKGVQFFITFPVKRNAEND